MAGNKAKRLHRQMHHEKRNLWKKTSFWRRAFGQLLFYVSLSCICETSVLVSLCRQIPAHVQHLVDDSHHSTAILTASLMDTHTLSLTHSLSLKQANQNLTVTSLFGYFVHNWMQFYILSVGYSRSGNFLSDFNFSLNVCF